MNVFRNYLRILPILPLLACAVYAGEPRGLSDRDIASIKASDKIWRDSALAGDWDKVAALYAPDAILLPPNAPAIEGRENIRKHFASIPPLTKLEMKVLETRGDGTLAYVRGTYALTITTDKGEPVSDAGKFLEIHSRQPNGEWLLLRDMYSSDGPAPAGNSSKP